jgi:hypothetical protein
MLEEKIREFLSNNGIYFTEVGQSLAMNCPNCGKNKLYISKDDGHYICFVCADTHRLKGPNVEFILQELTGKPVREINRFIRGIVSLKDFDLEKLYAENIQPEKTPEDPDFEFVIPRTFYEINHPEAKDGLAYLENKRGVPGWLAADLNIFYSPKYEQVIFPIYDGQKCVGYQGRAIYGKVKFNHVKKSHYLMFEHTISSDSVILAEGPISAIKFAKTGFGFVASMGKAVSETQVQRLKKLGVKKIYLALDRDAHKDVETFCSKWYNDFSISIVEVPERRDDFGDCEFDECVEAIANATPWTRMSSLPNWE